MTRQDIISTLRSGLAQIDAALDLADAAAVDLDELEEARNDLSIAIDHFESTTGSS